MTYLVSPAIAIPNDKRRFMPPDKFLPYSFPFSVKFRSFNSLLAKTLAS